MFRFPFSKPKRNQDGGPRTALFSFDRDRERAIALNYSAGRQDWIEARYRLIDEVLAYRRTGVLEASLLKACDAEFQVAAWAYSVGVRRLVELEVDGHAAAAERMEALRTSKDWRERYEALLTGANHTSGEAKRAFVRQGMADRSARIRAELSSLVVFENLFDMIDEVEEAAAREPKEARARTIFCTAFYTRVNRSTGRRSQWGGTKTDAEACDAAWLEFKARRRPDP